MNKSKGFTLIELLAVIVILAVIALIATPLIMGTITKAKRNSMKDTAYGILKAGEQYVGEKLLLAENDYNGETITLPNQNKIQYKGGNGLTGELQISKEGNLAIQIHNNQFCAIKNFGEDEVTVTNYDDETCKLNDTPDSVSFATDSWETIVANVRRNPSVYPVGDEKEVTLTGEYAGTYTVRVANNTTPAECNGNGFSQTACGFVVEFVDVIVTNVKMDTRLVPSIYGSNKGGWPLTPVRSMLQNGIFNALPTDLKGVILDTYTVSGNGGLDETNFITTDKLYLLSSREVFGNLLNTDNSSSMTRQLDYYKKKNVSESNVTGAIKQYNNSNTSWWLRSADNDITFNFHSVSLTGYPMSNNATRPQGVSPAFRVG